MSEDIPPYNQEAEEAVIAGCMLEHDFLKLAMSRLTPDDFYSGQNKELYESILQTYEEHKAIDLVTVCETLRRRDRHNRYVLEAVRISGLLFETTPGAPHIKIVSELSTRRKLINCAQRMAAEGYHWTKTLPEYLTFCTSTIHDVAKAASKSEDDPKTSLEVCKEVYKHITDEIKAGTKLSISTGFQTYDALIGGGIFPGDLIIMAARPGGGKSAAAMCMALNVAKQGHGVGFISLEMDRKQLMERAVCSQALIGMTRMRERKFSDQQLATLALEFQKVCDLPLLLEDNARLNIEQIALKIEIMRNQCEAMGKPLKLVVVDYVQLVKPLNRKTQTRASELDEIAYELKEIAKTMGITVLALAQFNRQADKPEDGGPTLSWLKESSGLEQAADNVTFIMLDKDGPELQDREAMSFFLAKQRNGPCRESAKMWFFKSYTRFEARFM